MSTPLTDGTPPTTAGAWHEVQAGLAGTVISLAPALTMGLLAFAALGAAPSLGDGPMGRTQEADVVIEAQGWLAGRLRCSCAATMPRNTGKA